MIFLKLGGSLITDKNQPNTARREVIQRLADEIVQAYEANPNLKLLVGHGSGSFGHHAAKKYQTQKGASTAEDWHGFAEVWTVANRLNRIVVDSFLQAGLHVVSFPPSASVICEDNQIQQIAIEPLKYAIDVGLIPILQGDVAFDRKQGSTIVSTEQVFEFLVPDLKPSKVLLVGIEEGVYQDYPTCETLIPHIHEGNIDQFSITTSSAPDVTGGMTAKVQQAMSMCRLAKGLEVRIFSGERTGILEAAINGKPMGTLISSEL
jgi:isopentenyl phosphate kinase